MRITTEFIEILSPCEDRFNNWKKHYGDKKPSLRKFTQLINITHGDKVWVLVRLLSEKNKVVFAIDMALSATQYADAADANAYAYAAANAATNANAYAAAAYAAYAAYAAANANAANAAYAANAVYAAYAAANAAAAARDKEEQEQLEILIYLIEGQKNV